MEESRNLFGPQATARFHRRRRLVFLSIGAVLCAAGSGCGSRTAAVSATGPKQVLYYVDPMHPSYRSDKPGTAPDCGMDLRPVYAGAESGDSSGAGAVHLTAEQERAIRLDTETPQMSAGTRTVRSVGRVAADEALTYAVSAGVDGWIRRVFSDVTGSQVKRGDSLAAFYSKDVVAPQQGYIYAVEALERLKHLPSPPADQLTLVTQQLATARDNLGFLGMGDAQIEQLGRGRAEFSDIILTAPVAGRILERHVAVGQRFMRGDLLYRIASLDRIWVLASVQALDLSSGGAVAGARILAEGLPPLKAEASEALPQFDEQGRAGKLRLVVDNRRGNLVPGMLVNVEIDIREHPALTVSADAVIDSGAEKHIFVAVGKGNYELRGVETGGQEAGRIRIQAGLRETDRVVTAGAFLLDSESRMKNPASLVTDPECGMKMDRGKARRLDRNGTAYYFCSESCERKFTARRPE